MNIANSARGALVLGSLALLVPFVRPVGAQPVPAVAPAAPLPAPAAGGTVAAAGSVTGGGLTFVPLSVDLPTGDRRFPPGPGVEVVQENCAACHSAGMVLTQPDLAPATWNAEVRKMIVVYKAPVSEEDAKTIISYLAAIKGAK